jgi:hypothetical protein
MCYQPQEKQHTLCHSQCDVSVAISGGHVFRKEEVLKHGTLFLYYANLYRQNLTQSGRGLCPNLLYTCQILRQNGYQ